MIMWKEECPKQECFSIFDYLTIEDLEGGEEVVIIETTSRQPRFLHFLWSITFQSRRGDGILKMVYKSRC